MYFVVRTLINIIEIHLHFQNKSSINCKIKSVLYFNFMQIKKMGKLIIFGEIVTIENAKTLLNQILLEEGIQQAIYTYKDVIRKKKK